MKSALYLIPDSIGHLQIFEWPFSKCDATAQGDKNSVIMHHRASLVH